jgi:hypothetical protein
MVDVPRPQPVDMSSDTNVACPDVGIRFEGTADATVDSTAQADAPAVKTVYARTADAIVDSTAQDDASISSRIALCD